MAGGLKRPPVGFRWTVGTTIRSIPVILIAALRQVNETIGETILASLESPTGTGEDTAWLQSHMAVLINEISAAPTPFALILDDYHTVTDLAIQQAVSFFLDRQPPQIHLVITTDPLPLAPASRGRVTEIRMSELQFCGWAAVSRRAWASLAPEHVIIESRTEVGLPGCNSLPLAI
jgi:LuxR family maltose regulon positive regulatory protein